MELLEVYKKRRSVRKYNGESISKENIDKIIKAGLTTLSSRNIKPWELIVVKDDEVLEKLSQSKTAGSAMIKDADCAIVVLGDKTKSDVWIEDCSIVMTYMHLMATSLGIGSCWVQCRLREAGGGRSSEDYVREVLNIPDNFAVEAILSLGNTDEFPSPHGEEPDEMKKVHYEVYNDK